MLGEGEPEHGVAEELETLVRLGAGVFGAPAPVGEGELEERAVVEPVVEAVEQPVEVGCGDQWLAHPRVDVVDGVAHRLEILEVLVVDPEADGAFAELLLERFDELDQRQGVGFEIVGEGLAFGDGRRIDLEDVGEAVADQLEDLVAADRAVFNMCLGGHSGVLPWSSVGHLRGGS
jgi:hypothetical protein